MVKNFRSKENILKACKLMGDVKVGKIEELGQKWASLGLLPF